MRRYPDMPCAADVVNTLDQQALASILTAYGEERHARKIASAIVEARRVNPITQTQQLASVVAGSSTLPWLISRSILEATRENKTRVELSRLSPCRTYLFENYVDLSQCPLPRLCFGCLSSSSSFEGADKKTELDVAAAECGSCLESKPCFTHTNASLSLSPHLFFHIAFHFSPPFRLPFFVTQMQTPSHAHTHDTRVHTAGITLMVLPLIVLFFSSF